MILLAAALAGCAPAPSPDDQGSLSGPVPDSVGGNPSPGSGERPPLEPDDETPPPGEGGPVDPDPGESPVPEPRPSAPLIDREGLYGGGSNQPPPSHYAAGVRAGQGVRPLGGTVLFASLGMSNTAQQWRAFVRLARPQTSATLIPTACAACVVDAWDDVDGEGWLRAAQYLRRQGRSEDDVQVVWMNVTAGVARPPTADDFDRILAAMRLRWPNVRQVFMSSRIYGGYNPDGEPAAYLAGVAVREFVLRHLGESDPWIGWGPYLWANGAEPGPDGLVWLREDYEADMIHPSESGAAKVGDRLLGYFSVSPFAPWF